MADHTLTVRRLGIEDANEIPVLPVFVDSPMAIDVTDIYRRHREDEDGATVRLT